MTRHLIRSLPEKGLAEDRLHPFFPIFAEDTGVRLSPRVHSGQSCSSAHGKKMKYSGRSFTPRQGV
jgi:hypothetical protein